MGYLQCVMFQKVNEGLINAALGGGNFSLARQIPYENVMGNLNLETCVNNTGLYLGSGFAESCG